MKINIGCLVEGCAKRHYGKGWCQKHYLRWYKHGDPLVMLRRENGTGTAHNQGYWSRQENGVRKLEHVRIAEAALGKPLPPKAEIHHVDGNKRNNDPTNLVICPNRAYHMLLHKRQRQMQAEGRWS